MNYAFKVSIVLVLEHQPDWLTSKHLSTKLFLETSPNLLHNQYVGLDEMPTKEGSKAMATALVQGIVTNIKHAEEKGFWTKPDHAKYVFEEIRRALKADAVLEDGYFDSLLNEINES